MVYGPYDSLWIAWPHQYGIGRIHIIEAGSEPRKLLCGRLTRNTPGEFRMRSDDCEPNCVNCLKKQQKLEGRANARLWWGAR